MELLYGTLEEKFKGILSGTCLTSIREENSRILKRYEVFDEAKLLEMKRDFMLYLSNYLFLKGYEKVESFYEKSMLVAEKDGEEYSFIVDFDHGGNDGLFRLKVLDKGVKCGISTSEAKYVFMVSIEKGVVAMMSCEKLKSLVKEKEQGFSLITETDSLFKSQFLGVDHTKLGRKARVFSLK